MIGYSGWINIFVYSFTNVFIAVIGEINVFVDIIKSCETSINSQKQKLTF